MSNSTFKKICITLITLIVIVLAAAIIIFIVAGKLTDKQVSSFESELTAELANDEYVDKLSCGEVSATILVSDSFLQLSNKEKLDKVNEYINVATAVRAKYDRLNDGNYVSIHIFVGNGAEIAQSNYKGQSQIITGK